MMKHAGGEYVDAALDDAETTGDVEDQEGEAADMLGAEENWDTVPVSWNQQLFGSENPMVGRCI